MGILDVEKELNEVIDILTDKEFELYNLERVVDGLHERRKQLVNEFRRLNDSKQTNCRKG